MLGKWKSSFAFRQLIKQELVIPFIFLRELPTYRSVISFWNKNVLSQYRLENHDSVVIQIRSHRTGLDGWLMKHICSSDALAMFPMQSAPFGQINSSGGSCLLYADYRYGSYRRNQLTHEMMVQSQSSVVSSNHYHNSFTDTRKILAYISNR